MPHAVDMVRRRLFLSACLLPAIVASARAAPASRRVALVVGNSAYRTVAPLPNAAGDALAVAAKLRTLDFAVSEGIDLPHAGFEEALAVFRAAATDADTALFYYSGHAFQWNGMNRLVPVDARLADPRRIPIETIDLGEVAMRTRSRLGQTLILLDACRNDPRPFASRDRSTPTGLAPLGAGNGVFVAFATEPGTVTYDGAGTSSPFTAALLAHMATPGVDISSMMIDVRNAVIASTGGRQVPWDQSSLRRRFFFRGAAIP